MAYADLVANIREALGVGSSHDASITAGITRNARFLLRNYNFREAVQRSAAIPLALGVSTFELPADAGKVKAVRLRQLDGATYLYKRLRRREEGQLPQRSEVGPVYYWFEAPDVILDTPIPQSGVSAEVWFQTISPTDAESWLSTTYADVLFHRTVYEMAPTKRKPEVLQIYSQLWQEDMVVLANYLQELEFGDLELAMGDSTHRHALDRYPSN